MSTEISIAGLREQDLDLFFLEEVVANESFRRWLLSQIPTWPIAFSDPVSARRSFAHLNGELDLVFTFQDSLGAHARLIAENKIGAGFQPDQLLRYQEHAAETRLGAFSHVAVILLAPHAYASGSSGKVDAMISYEEVVGWLSDQDQNERTSYKIQLLHTAIEKHGTGYNPDSDQPVTDFWLAYWREAESLAPELEMRRPHGKPSGSGFVWFACSDLPGKLNVCHKLGKGYVDLHFPSLGTDVGELRNALAPLLEPNMKVAKANKSAAVRIEVPPLKTGLPFDEQIDDVRLGIGAAKALRVWARSNSLHLDETERSLRS